MSAIEIYLKEIAKSRGLTRQGKLNNLRDYLKRTRIEEQIKGIKRITDIKLLRILWEAGLGIDMQKAVTARIEELARRRTGA